MKIELTVGELTVEFDDGNLSKMVVTGEPMNWLDLELVKELLMSAHDDGYDRGYKEGKK